MQGVATCLSIVLIAHAAWTGQSAGTVLLSAGLFILGYLSKGKK